MSSGKSIPGAANSKIFYFFKVLEFIPTTLLDSGLAMIPMLITYIMGVQNNIFLDFFKFVYLFNMGKA